MIDTPQRPIEHQSTDTNNPKVGRAILRDPVKTFKKYFKNFETKRAWSI